jgi:hypothetical protein
MGEGSRSEYEARDDHSAGIRNTHKNRGIRSSIRYRHAGNISCPQLSAEIGLQRTFRPNELYISSIPEAGLVCLLRDGSDVNVLHHPLVFLELEVLLPVDVGKAPLLRNDDLLATREFVAGTTEGLLNDVGVGVLATDGQQDLADVNPSDSSVRFTPSTSHTSLQPTRVCQTMA